MHSDEELALEQLELQRAADAPRWRAVLDELLELTTAAVRRRLETYARRAEAAPKKRRRAA